MLLINLDTNGNSICVSVVKLAKKYPSRIVKVLSSL